MNIIDQGQPSSKWVNVTPHEPCVICGNDSWCARKVDGKFMICRRFPTSGSFGAGKEKSDTDGNIYWVYRLGGLSISSFPTPTYAVTSGKGERAGPETLDQIYSGFLQALPLTHAHRIALRNRGLADDFIQSLGYRSLGQGKAVAVNKLIEAELEQHLPRVPGFYVRAKEGQPPHWTVFGPHGLLIPVRDAEGRIIALMVRRDTDESDGEATGSNKYMFLSAKKHGGPGPGSPLHVPVHSFLDNSIIRVTEGALKADIATVRSDLLTIGLPGVSLWARTGKLLKDLGAKTARLAFDADAQTNRSVATALSRLAKDLQSRGFAIELEVWNPTDAKGIDDLLTAGKTPKILSGDAVFAVIDQIVAAAMQADPLPGSNILDGKPLEAETDPHRLARLFRQKYRIGRLS